MNLYHDIFSFRDEERSVEIWDLCNKVREKNNSTAMDSEIITGLLRLEAA